MQNLGIVSGSGASYGWAINANGSVIVGKSDAFGATVGMRWTAATGMQSLGLMPGSPYSSAHGVSGDGSVVVGASAQPGFSAYHAFLWKSSLGMVDLNTYLPTLGLNLSGWTLSQALAVSSDGTAITGHGIFNGQTRAWVVRGLPGACSIADLVGGDGNPPADGSVDGNDFQAFLNAFGGDGALADLVGGDGNPPADGNVDGNDFQAFLNAFAAGC